MGIAYNTSIVRDGLVLYLDAANPKSYPGTGTSWFDLKGNNNSTLQNGVTFSSDNKGHFVFDGVNDYTQINIPTSVGSISFWYYYPGSGSNKMIMGNSSSFLFQGGSAGYIHWYNLTGDYSFGGWGTGFNQAGWIYITLTYSSNLDNKFYVNESLRKSSTSYNLNKGNGVYYVAGGYYNPQNCKFGLIKTYNRELTIEEIKKNFKATKGRYGI